MLSEEEVQAALRLQAILPLAQCLGIAGLCIEWLPQMVVAFFFVRFLLRSNIDVCLCVDEWISVCVGGWLFGCLGGQVWMCRCGCVVCVLGVFVVWCACV